MRINTSQALNSGDNKMSLKLVLLDRNAVDAIKRCVSGEYVENCKRRQLESLDRSRNTISPILSIIEGQSGRRESEEEIKLTLKKEAAAIRRFFKRARTDTHYFLSEEQIDNFSKTFGNNIEYAWDSYTDFIKSVFPLLYQPVSPTKPHDIENQLFELAAKHYVQISHPVLVVSLATLYGHEGARKTLKAKKEYETQDKLDRAAYNVVCDIMSISRIGSIKAAMSKSKEIGDRVQLFTFDKGLLSLVSAVTINWGESLEDGGTKINCSYSKKLFPALNDENYIRLTKRLGAII
mgnify:CR=1 FL=1